MPYNANDFKNQYIDSQAPNTFFKILTGDLNNYFFSHMHDVELKLYSKRDIIAHFYDFFNYLTTHYKGNNISRAYSSYYLELTKKRDSVQSYIWSIFYTFASMMEQSAELRAIKFSIEKNKSLDLVKFFQEIKNMVATVLSINFEVLLMDNLMISRKDLSQVLSAVFKSKLVSKMHLLKKIETRSNSKGISASDLAVVLISDMVKSRLKKEKLENKERIDFGEFWAKNSKNTTRKVGKDSEGKDLVLKFNNGDNEFVGDNDIDITMGLTGTKGIGYSSGKKKKGGKDYKEMIVDTREDLLAQMKYIAKSRSKTEEKIINSTTLIRKSVTEHNNLLEFVQELRDNYFDLFFKIKDNSDGDNLPVTDEDFRVLKSIDDIAPKDMVGELGEVRDPELVLKSMNQYGQGEAQSGDGESQGSG